MNVWVESARPRTLAAGVVPVVVGTAAAERLIGWRSLAALIVGASIQVGVNYANDLFDAKRGVDTPERRGPRRATAAGLVAASEMRTAMIIAFAVSAAAGVALSVAVGPELLIVGALCFVAALGYSGGPRPYGAAGLGELFVFIFFGLVATVGSAYVQIERITAAAVAAAVPVGLLATAILVANNLRDIDTDRQAGKITLAVRLEHEGTRKLYRLLVAGAFVSLSLVLAASGSPWVLAPLLSAPLAYRAIGRAGEKKDPAELVELLGATARLELVFGALLASGLWIS